MSNRAFGFAFLLVLAAMPGHAANLDLTPLHRQMQFSLGNPGARSLGMGGAFLGRADDASAAEANPAGLTIIARPEFTIEVGQTEVTSTVPTGGIVGTTAGYLDVSNDIGPNVTFVSVAAPVRSVVLSAYYHKPFDFEQSVGRLGTVISGQVGWLNGASAIQYHMDTFGLAGAWKRGGISIGGALRYQRLDPKSSGDFVDDLGALIGTLRTSGNDSDIAFSAGFKWSSPSDTVGIGGLYKSGSHFGFEESVSFADGQTIPFDSKFDAPDIWGLGVSLRPRESVTLNLDVNKIGYSSLLDNFSPALPCASGGNDVSCYHLSDATEIHFGVEWAMPNARVPVALRAGFWTDPAHSAEYNGSTADDLGKLAEFFFPKGDDQTHVTVGIGYLGGSFEVNAGYDHSDTNSKGTVSFLKRF